jgi:hypothetical protein
VEDTNGFAVGRKHLGEALIAVRRFIQSSSAENDVGPGEPILHHLRLDETFGGGDVETHSFVATGDVEAHGGGLMRFSEAITPPIGTP